AADADALLPLYTALRAELEAAKLEGVADLELRCLPAVVWMGGKGVAVDRAAWTALAELAGGDAAQLRSELDRAAPQKPGELYAASWNWDSPQQSQEALTLVGCNVADTSDEVLAAADPPLAQVLRRYRIAQKRDTVFGVEWLKHVSPDGRVY